MRPPSPEPSVSTRVIEAVKPPRSLTTPGMKGTFGAVAASETARFTLSEDAEGAAGDDCADDRRNHDAGDDAGDRRCAACCVARVAH